MPREISGLRIARSFVSPTEVEVSRVIDFQLGARQGIAIEAVLGEMVPDAGNFAVAASGAPDGFNATQTLHLESGNLETVPDAAAQDEDTIDSEVFYRQGLWLGGINDAATEFRASLAVITSPQGVVDYKKPIFVARNITHRAITTASTFDALCHVMIFYTFVEFSLAELGLILARRT